MHNICNCIRCEVIMELQRLLREGWATKGKAAWQPENTIEIESVLLLSVTEHICTKSRYPLLTLRVFLHILCGIDTKGCIPVNARHMAKRLDVHYCTLTKCLKCLREIGVVRVER